MADSALVHTDDDGVLSIFISGTEILFVCEHRHWWTVEAGDNGRASKAATKRAIDGELVAEKLKKTDRPLFEVGEKFGSGVYSAMRTE